MRVADHVKTYAKAYAAGSAVLVVGSIAGDITTMAVWVMSLIHVPVPEVVQTALTHIISALAGGGAAGVVANSNGEGGPS